MIFLPFFHLYGLLIGVGIILGVYVIERQSKWFAIPPAWLDVVLPWIVIFSLIGARTYHLVTDWQMYLGASWFELLAIWRGGVGFLGGLFGGMLGLGVGAYLLSKRRSVSKQPFLFRVFLYADLLVFGIPLAQAIGRIGNFVNHELYGLPTDLPWAITIDGKRYHPLFLYELLCNLLLWWALLLLSRKKMLVIGKGQYATLYIFGYAFIRFWLEFLRIETARTDGISGIFSIAQWVTLTLMIVATVLFWVRRHACPTKGGAPHKEWDFTLE
jgi:prolipoprotein diacylglyceryl transferase